jgi:hypothetical protein
MSVSLQYGKAANLNVLKTRLPFSLFYQVRICMSWKLICHFTLFHHQVYRPAFGSEIALDVERRLLDHGVFC